MNPGSVRMSRLFVFVGITASFLFSVGAHAQAMFQPLGGSGSQSQTFTAGTMPLGVAVGRLQPRRLPGYGGRQ